MYVIHEMEPSIIDTSKCCPSPLASRALRAARIAIVAYMPAPMSVIATPIRTGGEPGSPVMPMRPPIPWMMRSYPGHEA